jgi:hypothetical protein
MHKKVHACLYVCTRVQWSFVGSVCLLWKVLTVLYVCVCMYVHILKCEFVD